MNNQISIFDLFEKQKPTVYVNIDVDHCFPAARNTDPETSHEAAARVDFREKHFALILNALVTPLGKDGIGAKINLTGEQVARRLSELERLGKVRVTGRTVLSNKGRNEREFERV